MQNSIVWLTYSPSLLLCTSPLDSMHSHASLALIGCRLRPGREYAPNKQYVLNSGVRLIIRVYRTTHLQESMLFKHNMLIQKLKAS